MRSSYAQFLNVSCHGVIIKPIFISRDTAWTGCILRFLEAAFWSLEHDGGKRVSEFIENTIAWRESIGAHCIRKEDVAMLGAKGTIFVKGHDLHRWNGWPTLQVLLIFICRWDCDRIMCTVYLWPRARNMVCHSLEQELVQFSTRPACGDKATGWLKASASTRGHRFDCCYTAYSPSSLTACNFTVRCGVAGIR